MEIHENAYKSMEIHGNPQDCIISSFKGTPADALGRQTLSQIHEKPWKSMKIHVNLWKSMEM